MSTNDTGDHNWSSVGLRAEVCDALRKRRDKHEAESYNEFFVDAFDLEVSPDE